MRQVFVHREEDIEISRVGDEAQKLAIFDARPARARNGLNFVAGQIAPQTRGQTFIKQDTHSGDLGNFLKHGVGRFFQEGDGLLARNGGEIIEENINAVTTFEVVKEGAHGNARASKARLAAHNFRVNLHHETFLHARN